MESLKATIDRFEGEKAVLILEDGQRLVVDKEKLDASLKEGDVVYLSFTFSARETADKEKSAKNILKQLLKREDEG